MSDDSIFSPEARENIKNAFDAFDDDRDDMIEAGMIGKLLRALGFNPTPEEVDDMVEDCGADKIDFKAFMYILSRHAREADPAGELVDSFRVFDKEGTGKLPKDTIIKILQNLKQPFTSEQIEELIGKSNPDSRGNIDYVNFVDLLLNY